MCIHLRQTPNTFKELDGQNRPRPGQKFSVSPAVSRTACKAMRQTIRGWHLQLKSDRTPTFWNLKGIDFDASAARNGTEYYCHVSCLTEDVISLFPPAGEEVTGAKQIGKSFVLRAETKASLRGRPPYPWEAFHWEVTAMLLAGNLPQKKEAAIQHFQQWFQQTKGIRPSRAAIGEKLTPYYEKFVRAAGQKI